MAQVTYAVRDAKALWNGRTLAQAVPDLVRALVAEFDPVQIILFGSVAAGTDGPDSDVDMMMVLDHANDDRRRQLMVDALRATHDVHVPRDILVTDVARLARNRSVVGTIERMATKDGVVVYERPDN